MESGSHASHIVSSIKSFDTLERSALKIHRRVFVSCSRAKSCNFCGLLTFCSETFPVERATQIWRSMRKTTLCKKTRESPGSLSSLIGQKKFFLANQKQAIQTLLELQGGKTFCASFCASFIAGSRRDFLCVDCVRQFVCLSLVTERVLTKTE